MYQKTLDFSVDTSRCIRCGFCTDDCMNHAIEPDPATGFPRIAPDGGAERCMHCRHCLMICPVAAVSVDGVKPEDCAPCGKLPVPEELLNLVRSRRSYRHYLRKNVDPALLKRLLDAMRYVPTGVNRRGLAFSVIDDFAVMDAYREKVYADLTAFFRQRSVPEKALRFEKICRQRQAGEDPVFRSAPHLLVVSVAEDSPCTEADPLIALSYFELLAQANGIATVWFGRIMSLYRMVLPDIFKPFRIPEGYRPAYAMLFGESALFYPRTCSPDALPVIRMSLKDASAAR